MKRLGTLNGKVIVETNDLNTLKKNEIALKYVGNDIVLYERNLVGEVVPTTVNGEEYELVTVECNVAKFNENKNTLVLSSSKDAQLHINCFDRAKKYDEQVLTINDDEDYRIKFLAVKGRHYVIHFTIAGNGASFCQEFDAGNKEREIILWSLPTGVYNWGYATYTADNMKTYDYTASPIISTDNNTDTIDSTTLGINYHDRKYPESENTNSDESCLVGVLISKENWSAIIDNKSIVASDNRNTQWATGAEKHMEIPFITTYNDKDYIGPNDDFILKHDKSGTLNSAIIRMFHPNNNVIKCAEEGPSINDKRPYISGFIPSIGQLFDIYKLRSEIEALNNTVVDLSNLFNNYYWSSDQFNTHRAWSCHFNDGYCGCSYKHTNYYVLGLCAYSYIY